MNNELRLPVGGFSTSPPSAILVRWQPFFWDTAFKLKLTMTWTELEDFYFKLDTTPQKREKFLELICHIKNTGLSKRLFAIISLDKLIVSVYENIEFQKEALHISFDLFQQNWNFKYYAKPFMNAEWDKTYPSNLGIQKFDQFVKYIRW